MADTLDVKKLKPTPGYVLVKPAEAQQQTKSGIYLPESGDEKPQNGVVLAVGDAAYVEGQKIDPPVKKGAQVIYKKWGGNDVKIGDVEYQFLKFEDILAEVA